MGAAKQPREKESVHNKMELEINDCFRVFWLLFNRRRIGVSLHIYDWRQVMGLIEKNIFKLNPCPPKINPLDELPFGTFKRWSQSAAYCYFTEQNCQGCDNFAVMGNACKMPYAVAQLFKNEINPPKGLLEMFINKQGATKK